MKKLLLIVSCIGLSFLMSCGSDDAVEVETGLTGTITFDGAELTASDGLFGEASDEDGYAATFFISDGELTYDPAQEQATFQGEYLINVIIYNTGSAFESGNYSIASLDSPISDKSAFVVYADVANASSGGSLATGGTVNIQGSGNVYTLTFAVDYGNDVELVGTISGTFERVEIPVQ